MSGGELLLLVVAGVGGGLVGSTAGLASLMTYPALLAVGLGAVEANVTNTVALVFVTVGAVLGSRPELRGQLGLVRRLAAVAALGGAVGAGLLLLTSADTFEKLVPWLIGGASLAIMRPRRVAAATDARRGAPRAAVTGGVFLIAIYGGYFGAAAGVVMLALLLGARQDTLARTNAVKNVILGGANATAALAFCLLAPVDWPAVAPLALGLLAGGRLGPVVVRHADDRVLRAVIGLAGIGLAIKLGVDAYG